MTEPFLLEAIGYAASILVAISLMMSSVLRLRIINLIGSLTFALYGGLIGATPVLAVNLFIAGVNVYYLRKMLGSREYFRILEAGAASEYVRYFLGFYEEEIRRFTPGARISPEADLSLLILRDVVPAGLLIGDVRGATLEVSLDFVIPQYRDFKVGRYLFEDRADYFRARGIREIVSDGGSRDHARYLERMGFQPDDPAGDANARYRLTLPVADSAPDDSSHRGPPSRRGRSPDRHRPG